MAAATFHTLSNAAVEVQFKKSINAIERWKITMVARTLTRWKVISVR
jgi:hypothetical protein